ncbi:MAG: hypothetical protein M3Z23_15150 [Acidobacteriota bacterium]|nr:hypothetical protein [Acidobacteriota bacterium]
MKRLSVQSLIAMILAAHVGLLPAAAPAIGVALANGNVMVDNARTPGNAPLFEGNTVETGTASSRLQLQNGASVQLASDSRGKVFSNRLILEKGTTQFRTSKGYEIDALTLKIAGTEANSSARVSMRGPVIQVAALNGHVNVVNARGVRIASLAAGRALDFTPQDTAGATGASTMTGCLSQSDNAYYLTDETSNVTVELRGGSLSQHVGHRIQVTGSMLASGTPTGNASQVVNVSDIKMLGTGCTMPAGAAAGAGTGGAAAAAGMGAAHGTAIIAGIVVAAAVGSTVGVIATSGESTNNTVSPVR